MLSQKQLHALELLVELRDSGALSDDEFDNERGRIVNSGSTPADEPVLNSHVAITTAREVGQSNDANARGRQQIPTSGEAPFSRQWSTIHVLLLVGVIAAVAVVGWVVVMAGRSSESDAVRDSSSTVQASDVAVPTEDERVARALASAGIVDTPETRFALELAGATINASFEDPGIGAFYETCAVSAEGQIESLAQSMNSIDADLGFVVSPGLVAAAADVYGGAEWKEFKGRCG